MLVLVAFYRFKATFFKEIKEGDCLSFGFLSVGRLYVSPHFLNEIKVLIKHIG